MSSSPQDSRKAQMYGRVLVLLAIRNELRMHRAPMWRQERHRLEIDRALAQLTQY